MPQFFSTKIQGGVQNPAGVKLSHLSTTRIKCKCLVCTLCEYFPSNDRFLLPHIIWLVVFGFVKCLSIGHKVSEEITKWKSRTEDVAISMKIGEYYKFAVKNVALKSLEVKSLLWLRKMDSYMFYVYSARRLIKSLLIKSAA